jgi:hypothetical protein
VHRIQQGGGKFEQYISTYNEIFFGFV